MSAHIATLDLDRTRLDEATVKQLFLDARSHNRWLDRPVDEALLRLAGGLWRSNFLVNLGYGDPAGLFPRNPRLDFEEACRID